MFAAGDKNQFVAGRCQLGAKISADRSVPITAMRMTRSLLRPTLNLGLGDVNLLMPSQLIGLSFGRRYVMKATHGKD